MAASPMARAPAAWPSCASACDRLRGPGSIQDQPSRSPAPVRDEHAGQLQQAVREDQPEEQVEPAGAGHQAAGDADVERVLPEHPDHRERGTRRGSARGPSTFALLVATCAAKEPAGWDE